MRAACGLLALAACSSSAPKDSDSGVPLPDVAKVLGWSQGTPVAQGAIQETAAVAVNGRIYVIGGFDDTDGVTNRVQIYNPQSGAWAEAPPLPVAVHHANAATDGTTIWIAGALTGLDFAPIGDVYSLAPDTETAWTPHASLPAGRERGAAITDIIDGKLYVAAGYRGGASDFTDVYDLSTDTWTAAASLPMPRDHACGAAMMGALVVVGGRTSSPTSPQPDVWAYDPAMDAWNPRTPMPTARGGMGCGVIDGVLYTTGGEGNPAAPSGVFPNVEAYAYESDTWMQFRLMPSPKHGVGGATWDGALYLCGGANQQGFGAVDSVDVFRP